MHSWPSCSQMQPQEPGFAEYQEARPTVDFVSSPSRTSLRLRELYSRRFFWYVFLICEPPSLIFLVPVVLRGKQEQNVDIPSQDSRDRNQARNVLGPDGTDNHSRKRRKHDRGSTSLGFDEPSRSFGAPGPEITQNLVPVREATVGPGLPVGHIHDNLSTMTQSQWAVNAMDGISNGSQQAESAVLLPSRYGISPDFSSLNDPSSNATQTGHPANSYTAAFEHPISLENSNISFRSKYHTEIGSSPGMPIQSGPINPAKSCTGPLLGVGVQTNIATDGGLPNQDNTTPLPEEWLSFRRDFEGDIDFQEFMEI
jgi:hypothetical protein